MATWFLIYSLILLFVYLASGTVLTTSVGPVAPSGSTRPSSGISTSPVDSS